MKSLQDLLGELQTTVEGKYPINRPPFYYGARALINTREGQVCVLKDIYMKEKSDLKKEEGDLKKEAVKLFYLSLIDITRSASASNIDASLLHLKFHREPLNYQFEQFWQGNSGMFLEQVLFRISTTSMFIPSWNIHKMLSSSLVMAKTARVPKEEF